MLHFRSRELFKLVCFIGPVLNDCDVVIELFFSSPSHISKALIVGFYSLQVDSVAIAVGVPAIAISLTALILAFLQKYELGESSTSRQRQIRY